MFEEQSSADKKVEDIFSATDQAAAGPSLGPPSALAQGKLQPVAAGSRSSLPAEQLSALPKVGFPFKKAMAIALVSLVVVGGAGASWFWWQKRSQSQPAPEGGSPKQESGQTQPSDSAREGSPGVFEGAQERAINRALNPLGDQGAPAGTEGAAGAPGAEIPATAGADTDSDGLSDGEELQLGTNLRLVDTDGDGLSDWEEAKIFTTNPLQADTDGDTYSDGVEVQNGFNPKGAGKLLDFQRAKESVNQ